MARVKGKKVSGSIGNVTHRDTKDGQVASEKIVTINQSENSKKAGVQFGKASGLASRIRFNMDPIIDGLNDGALQGRLLSEFCSILGRYHDQATKTYSFVKSSFGRLAGMDFNINSPLRNSLWGPPEIAVEENVLFIRLPEFINGKDLIFPNNTNLCFMQFQISLYALSSGYYRNDLAFEFHIEKKQEVVELQQLTFEIPKGVLVVVGIMLQFSRAVGNRITMFNTKMFSPGHICDAIYVPGEFILPPQESIHKAKHLWKTMHLEFPATI